MSAFMLLINWSPHNVRKMTLGREQHSCLIFESPESFVSQREADFGPNRRRLSPAASSHDHQGLVSITGVHLLQAIERAKLAAALKHPGHQPNTPLHHWHPLSQSRVLDEANLISCLPLKENTKRKRKERKNKKNASCTFCMCISSPDQGCMCVTCTEELPCSLICLICLTVSLRIAHLSGLTLKLSMLERLAEMSSASSSMYLLSCSLRRLSHLPGSQRGLDMLPWRHSFPCTDRPYRKHSERSKCSDVYIRG